jgi:hypothetical protein
VGSQFTTVAIAWQIHELTTAATRRDSGQGHERERHVYDPERTIAGWITLATIFIREFSILLFLYSPGSEPLGPLLYFYYLYGAYGRIATVGLVSYC